MATARRRPERESTAKGGRRRHRDVSLLAVLTLLATTVGLVGLSTTATAGASQVSRAAPATSEAPLFAVTQEGMTQQQADALAEQAGIRSVLDKRGGFTFVDAKRYGKVPTTKRRTGKDERGHRTVARKLNLTKIRAIQTLSDSKALEQARLLLTLPSGFAAEPNVTHTELTLSDLRGKKVRQFDLDTAVSYELMLAQHRVVGPGNRNRIAFNGHGRVVSLNQNLRDVEQQGYVGIIGPEDATAECSRLYGPNVEMLTPELVYYSPALGDGSVKYLLPHYSCRPAADVRADQEVIGKLVPAAPEFTPMITLDTTRDGSSVEAAVSIKGGTEPFAVKWASSSTQLKGRGESMAYDLTGRGRAKLDETLTATVTDANGIVSAVSVVLGPDGGQATASGYGGEGGILSSFGVVNTVDEWQCAQDSANGFRNVMAGKGHTKKFDWRGTNAWETDFKKTSAGGHDKDYVDAVDIQWYTGHGSPGGFTFKNNAHSDGDITPSDARWGDNFNLEWLQLESCQVLADTNGTNDYFQRWAPAFDGLHILNGFHTNASCIGGGTGALFARLLFPEWWHGALTITQAWQTMANSLEPTGRVWRSISPAKAGWVTNLGDHMWGQGSVGPDIPLSQQIGWVAISGTV